MSLVDIILGIVGLLVLTSIICWWSYVTRKPKTSNKNMKKLLTVMALALGLAVTGCLSTGCAYMHSITYDPATGKRQTVATAYTMFDANSQLAKFRNTSSVTTNGQWGAGTSLSGLDQSSQTTTNFNDLVGTIVNAAVKGATGK